MNSDQELLRQIRAGNEKAFEALVLRYQDVVYRLALRQLGDTETAGDVVQEVFLRAWKKLRHWSWGRGKLFTWLYRTTRNVCCELHRRRRRDPLCSWDFDNDRIPMPEDCRECEEEDYSRVQRLVRELPPRQEQVVWLHTFEGLQLKEVAVVLGIPIGTVKSNYHKALGNLRKAWVTRISHQPSTTTADMAPPASLRSVGRPRGIAEDRPSDDLGRKPCRHCHLSHFTTKASEKSGLTTDPEDVALSSQRRGVAP